jgi:tRNA (cmo5U34)-methyltransferase
MEKKKVQDELTEVDAFYDAISKSYTEAIRRCVPEYEEMLKSLFIYLNPDFTPKTILELGCGTGNLTQLAHQRYPNAAITAVDISAECINECKSRISSPNVQYVKSDFKEIDFPQGHFDLVISSISIHHLRDADKEVLFQKLHGYQAPNGVLSFGDQFSGENAFIYQKHIERWKAFALEQGASIDEWEMWMKHQQDHDYHSTLANHLLWIKSAGYTLVDCTRRHLLWTTIYAEK